MPIILLLTLMLTVAPAVHAEQWTTYTDAEAGFSVSYPADWGIETKPMPRAEIRMEAPGGGAPTRCGFGYERYEGIESIDAAVLLDKFLSADEFLELYRPKYDDVKVTKVHRGMWADQEAAFTEASYSTRSSESQKAVRYLTLLVVTRGPGGLYDCRCVLPQADFGHWDRVVREIVESFRILERTN